MKVLAALSAIGLSLLAACAPMMTPERIAGGDYGPPPPENYREHIKADFVHPFIDPDSPVYRFGTPKKAYTERNRIGNTREMFGWVVCGTVQRRGKLSGYQGYTEPMPFYAFFKDGRIVQRLLGEEPDNEYGTNFLINSAIAKVCKGAAVAE